MYRDEYGSLTTVITPVTDDDSRHEPIGFWALRYNSYVILGHGIGFTKQAMEHAFKLQMMPFAGEKLTPR